MVVASPAPWAAAAPLHVGYLDETALVFEAAQPKDSRLPPSILLHGIPLTFASDIRQACNSVQARQGDLLAFLPDSKSCLTLTELFSLAREVHPEQALFGLLERDRRTLLKGLETESFLVMQPRSAAGASGVLEAVVVAGVCTCPNLPDPIFDDGFEDIP